MRHNGHWIFGLTVVFLSACVFAKSPKSTPVWAHEIVTEYPHDPTHFTQGLLWHDNALIESTGLYGRSGLYRKSLESGDTQQHYRLNAHLFGEGITVHGPHIWQLTWREGLILIYSLDLEPSARFPLTTQGWGLTGNGRRIWMTDGSATLFELSPVDGQIVGRVTVTEHGRPLHLLNELEWIDGLIFANRFGKDDIIIFDPDDGIVVGRLDLRELRQRFKRPAGWSPSDHVLNGIAWRADTRQLLVTGKSWPTLFALTLDWPDSVGNPGKPPKQ